MSIIPECCVQLRELTHGHALCHVTAEKRGHTLNMLSGITWWSRLSEIDKTIVMVVNPAMMYVLCNRDMWRRDMSHTSHQRHEVHILLQLAENHKQLTQTHVMFRCDCNYCTIVELFSKSNVCVSMFTVSSITATPLPLINPHAVTLGMVIKIDFLCT